VALSFANRASDVEAVREASLEGATVISKIECLNGLVNLPEISDRSDALLIDRGDLSRQVNLEKIPALQKDIIRFGRDAGKRVYVATNLMESMVTAPMPTRAEVNDVFNTLMDGADGLVLAAESAVGRYPVEATIMIRKLIREYEHASRWKEIGHATAPLSPLVEPHGGLLVDRVAPNREAVTSAVARSLELRPTELLDCSQIAHGVYSPLTGFMGSEELDSVLRGNRLLNGLPWTVPVLLQVHEPVADTVVVGDRVALSDGTGTVYATMQVSEVFALQLEDLATKWFGTTSSEHPGVGGLYERGNHAIAGQITLVEDFQSAYPDYELTPSQARLVFAQKGWTKVVGAPVRGVPEGRGMSPEMRCLEDIRGDGLYLGPVVGPTKKDDFFEDLMLKSYQLLLTSESYPAGKVILGAVSSYPRYCPEREIVFDALRFKNIGCSHFAVPAYHAVGASGEVELDLHGVFDAIGDLGIVPVHARDLAGEGRDRALVSVARPELAIVR
jgi:ATP sulfurylase